MSAPKKILPYGTWPTTISAKTMGSRLAFSDVQWAPDGQTLVWLESRSGQGMLVAKPTGGAPHDLFTDFSARGGILYGGAEFCLSREHVFFVDHGRELVRCDLRGGDTRAIVLQSGAIAAPTPSPDGKWLIYIASDGQEDWLALVDSSGAHPSSRLVGGTDFYMQPHWHPSGSALAWVEWDHPNMPFDATRIVLARLAGSPPGITHKLTIAGNERSNFTQPLFSPNGRWLSYIASCGNWERLLLYEIASGESRVLLEGEQLLISSPAWVQGVCTTGWSRTSERIFLISNFAGEATLQSVEIANGKVGIVDTSPYTWMKQLSVSPTSDDLAVIASSPQISEQIVVWRGKSWQVVAPRDAQTITMEWYSMPQDVHWLSQDGVLLHAFYYPPANPDYTGEGAPPMIVNVHGGPTHQAALYFPREAPFFTSRGYAFLDVNYRGTIGFGLGYQSALNGSYGELDTEDVVSAAMAMVERGLADGSRLALYGGSSGGMTVLNVLARYPGRFIAAVCLYPVTDLLTLVQATDKFESHYLDRLVGLLPSQEQVYRDRSPLYHADLIKDPVAFFHGTEDTAVPLVQSEHIAASLRRRGVPVLLQVYEGEGHRFRKIETLEDCFNQVERFLEKYVLSAP